MQCLKSTNHVSLARLSRRLAFSSVALLIIAASASGAVPQLINYQGMLTDNAGFPLPNLSYTLTFAIYDAPSGGTVLWTEDQTVTTSNGIFNVKLGAVNTLADSIFNGDTRYLGVRLSPNSEFTPRDRIVSSGYSYRVGTIDGAFGGNISGQVYIAADSSSGGALIVNVQDSSSSLYNVGVSAGVVNSYGFPPGPIDRTCLGGFFQASALFGNSYGVYAQAGDYGVYGSAGNSGVYGSGVTHGVNGNGNVYGVRGSGDFGLYGSGTTYGLHATGYYGVSGAGFYAGYFGSTNTSNSTGYGIFCNNGGNPYNYAGYFLGEVHVTALLTKAGGGFKIDHPTDPANKYLYHSFVESPDMKNIYDGVVIIDSRGEATVTLPDWFGALNEDFRYQLTCVGCFAPLYVSEEIFSNQFKIAGGTPGMKVCWQVTGIRKDVYAEVHRLPVEKEKSAQERGKYLHPVEHGVSETLGMHYKLSQEMAAMRILQEEQQLKLEAEQRKHEEMLAKIGQEKK